MRDAGGRRLGADDERDDRAVAVDRIQREPGRSSAFAGDEGHRLKPSASTSLVASRTNVIALLARPMNCLKSSPNRITSARWPVVSFGQTGPGCGSGVQHLTASQRARAGLAADRGTRSASEAMTIAPTIAVSVPGCHAGGLSDSRWLTS